ncbi:hypothetical protein L195_g046383, partial [Trifolium pratense]
LRKLWLPYPFERRSSSRLGIRNSLGRDQELEASRRRFGGCRWRIMLRNENSSVRLLLRQVEVEIGIRRVKKDL